MHNYTDQTGNGLMHGDIRPGTSEEARCQSPILVSLPSFSVGLKEGDRHWAFTDLLSLVFQNNSNTISDLSLQEDAKQSVAFWGPEMWLTRKPTPKSDIYALGVSLWCFKTLVANVPDNEKQVTMVCFIP